MQLSKNEIMAFQQKILSWYAQNKRDLPWRHTRDPYKILVSEIMLQQTQVSRVIPKYEAWLQAFPKVEDLARAKTADVLRLWSGLGYNRRALYLKQAAEGIVGRYNGMWPKDPVELQKLPGIGAYTSGAVACFAFNAQVAVVDTNIRKVIVTQFGIDSKEKVQEVADQLLPRGKAYDWNQALMDYSSVMLKKEKIVIPKQSPFRTSNRYYRGLLLKRLTTKASLTQQDITLLFADKDARFVELILRGLLKDGLIVKKHNTVQLP